MSWLHPFLVYTATTLCALTAITWCYYLWFRNRLRNLVEKVPTADPSAPFPDTSTVARYSEYKHRYGSRTREIAVIASSKQHITQSITNEFVETVRENGTLLYHFTSYWGQSNLKRMQEQIDTILRGKYHAAVPLGLTATRMLKYASLNQRQPLPIIFGCVRDTWWQDEQSRKKVTHMTGVTGSSGWQHRISFYHAVQPNMRAALIPVTSSQLKGDAEEVSKLLHDRGITPHAIKVHDTAEIINMITHYPEKIDALICLQDSLTPTIAAKISVACAQRRIAYFSPYKADTKSGAAVSVTCTDMRIGWHLGQKMIHLLEEYKSPSEIPLTNIGMLDYPYEAHFNQHAMKAQGLDPSIIASLALHYGSAVHISTPNIERS